MTAERKTILVAVDFEGASKRALASAKWLADAIDADLTLLHVHDRPGFDHPELPGDMVARIEGLVEQAGKRSLEELAAEHGAKRTLFRRGDPAARILEAVAELRPAMVVMGTHGRRGLNRLLVGSIAAQVLRVCPVPVVTVRAQKEDLAA
jgi:nucleotide-binding universal stress UspA family protein